MLKIEELIEEEIYKQDLNKDGLLRYLFKKGLNKAIELNSDFFCENWVDNQFKGNITKANKEEEHWLNECIKADKFIPYEKAIKTFQKELSKEEVLAKAKKDYPIGTKFKSLSKDKILEVIGDYFRWSGKELILDSDSVKNTDSAWIIYNGEWAEIISKPEFIVNKWYKLPNNFIKKGSPIIYIKLLKIDSNNNQCYKEKIVKNKGYEILNYINSDLNTKIELLTDLTEIQEFLPSSHTDKIQTNIMEEKKSIKEWSVGSYVVITGEYHSTKIGEVHKIENSTFNSDYIDISESVKCACLPSKSFCKWFPTLQEAEIFSRSLLNNNSVPEYVECINTNTKKIILGKIYKIFDTSTYPEKVSIILDDGEQYNIRDWDESFIKNGNNCFKPSTFKELSAQESLKQWRKLVNIKFTNNCTLNTKECISNSDVIEIGDEVEVVKITKFSTDSGIYLKANIGDRFKVKVAPSNYSESLEIGIKINDGKDYTYPVECFKLIKKASQTTLNTKVDSISPVKVNTNLLNIIKVKGSAPTKVEKKRIRLTILKTKQLNLN